MFILNLSEQKKKKNSLPYLKKISPYNNVTINLDNMPAELLFLDEDDEMNIEEETNDLAIDSSEKNHRNNYTSSFFICELSDRNHLSKQIINNLTYF